MVIKKCKANLYQRKKDNWADIWKQQRRKRGDLRYNAMWLARIENNNAFREGAKCIQ